MNIFYRTLFILLLNLIIYFTVVSIINYFISVYLFLFKANLFNQFMNQLFILVGGSFAEMTVLEQAHLIDKLGKRVIVCPDKDKAGVELIDQALELGWEVSFPDWHTSCKDAADAVLRYGRLATIKSIIDCATNNKIKIQVKSKMI